MKQEIGTNKLPLASKKRKVAWGKIWDNKLLYLLLLPGLIYYIIFRFIPIGAYLIAFKDLAPFEGIEAMFTADWVGLKHFKDFISSYYFWNIFNNTIILAVCRLLIEFTLPIILALMINEVVNMKFKKVVQTISYMPYFISNVVLAGLVFMLFSTNGGLIPEIVKFFGGNPKYYVTDPTAFRGILLGAVAWKNIGWSSIIYLAAMSGISPEFYEAASIDGASKWQQMMKITIPSISFAIMIMFILRIGVIMNEGWEETLLLYSPAVYKIGDIIDTYVYRAGIEELRYSFATAVNLFKSIIGLVLVWITNVIAKKMGHENMYS